MRLIGRVRTLIPVLDGISPQVVVPTSAREDAAADYGRPSAYQRTKSVIGGVAPSCRILDAF